MDAASRNVPGRRAFLRGAVALAAAGTAGCDSGGRGGADRTPAPGAATALPVLSATPFPRSVVWAPNPGDVRPDVKLRAVQLIEAIGAWPPGQQGLAAARARVAALGLAPDLADQAGAALLVDRPQAAIEVIEAQYGGILDASASVLVVCRQWTPEPGGTTVDVRLVASAPRWTVTELHPAAPSAPIAAPPTAAARVLASPHIDLPPAAIADLRSGAVHETVSAALLRLAADHDLGVSVLRSGHPLDVFGTTRPSDHPAGRAVDVWRIDGRPVVDPATPRALVEDFMRAAAAAGSYNVGGPYPIAGGTGNRFFTDPTHHDHVHIGFTT
jgi:hypothetical protein